MFDLDKEDSDKLKRGLDEIKELGETAADDALDPYERLSMLYFTSYFLNLYMQ
jgi:hypothetical protein